MTQTTPTPTQVTTDIDQQYSHSGNLGGTREPPTRAVSPDAFDPFAADFWVVDAEHGVIVTPKILHETDLQLREFIDELGTRMLMIERGPDTSAALLEEWLHKTLAPTYYFTNEEIEEILANTALKAEFDALRIMYLASFTGRGASPSARVTWHDALARVIQRYHHWVGAKRASRADQ